MAPDVAEGVIVVATMILKEDIAYLEMVVILIVVDRLLVIGAQAI